MKVSATIRNSILVSAVLLVGMVVWLLCTIFHPFEPRQPEYRGKKLTEWAEEIDAGFFSGSSANLSNQVKSELAVAAIRHIGTNALPWAVRLCGTQDTWPRSKFAEWVYQYNNDYWPERFPVEIVPAWEKNYEGVQIIWALGPTAEPAVPALIHLLQSEEWDLAETATMALPGIGTNVVPPLLQVLNNPGNGARIRAATILAEHFSSQAHPAVPVLLDCLKHRQGDTVIRLRAIYSLSFVKQDSMTIVPEMIRYVQNETNNLTLQNPHFLELGGCLRALGHFGTNAEPAVPLLVKILKSDPLFPNPNSQGPSVIVLGALNKIDPDAAEPFMTMWQSRLTNASVAPQKDSRLTTEPAYQGRWLSEWLRDFAIYATPASQTAAAEAIRHIGSPAVPSLVDHLSEARWKQFTTELQKWQEQPRGTSDFTGQPPDPRREALCALDALGSEGAHALPAVEKLLQEDPPDPAALYVIARMGPAGGPILEKYRNSDVRILKLEANVCLELIASHSEILYPRIPAGPDAPSFNLRICEFNLAVMQAAAVEYRKEHPDMNIPANFNDRPPPSIPAPAQ